MKQDRTSGIRKRQARIATEENSAGYVANVGNTRAVIEALRGLEEEQSEASR